MTDSPLPEGVSRDDTLATVDDAVGVSLPVGFRAVSNDDGFQLTIRARAKWIWPIAFFALLWNGFLVVWFGVALSSGLWGMALFGTLHLLVGIGLGYVSLRGLLNRVEVQVTRGVLGVRHRPLPWFGPGPLARENIDQLYVEADHSLKVNGRPVERYALKLREKNGKTHTLCVTEHADQARYVEREVERAFHIDDRQMPGQLRELEPG